MKFFENKMHHIGGFPVHLISTFLFNFLYFKPIELKWRMSKSADVRINIAIHCCPKIMY